MDLQESKLNEILAPFLPDDVIEIFHNYLRPLKYYVLGYYNKLAHQIFNDKEKNTIIEHVFQAQDIEDVIHYILYIYPFRKEFFIRDGKYIIFSRLEDAFFEYLSPKQQEQYYEDIENFWFANSDMENEVLSIVQKLYGNNPDLFLSELETIQKVDEYYSFFLMELNPLVFIFQGHFAFENYYKCVNIYTGKKCIFDFKDGSKYLEKKSVKNTNRPKRKFIK
jgi:hypothetical protein